MTPVKEIPISFPNCLRAAAAIVYSTYSNFFFATFNLYLSLWATDVDDPFSAIESS